MKYTNKAIEQSKDELKDIENNKNKYAKDEYSDKVKRYKRMIESQEKKEKFVNELMKTHNLGFCPSPMSVYNYISKKGKKIIRENIINQWDLGDYSQKATIFEVYEVGNTFKSRGYHDTKSFHYSYSIVEIIDKNTTNGKLIKI